MLIHFLAIIRVLCFSKVQLYTQGCQSLKLGELKKQNKTRSQLLSTLSIKMVRLEGKIIVYGLITHSYSVNPCC